MQYQLHASPIPLLLFYVHTATSYVRVSIAMAIQVVSRRSSI